jgi:hypothetical protein
MWIRENDHDLSQFHGHMLTTEWLKPSRDKIRTVQGCTTPKTREELVLLLQMLAPLSRYINNFSSRCDPLRRLTRNNAKFEWTNEQQAAFDNIKKAITSAPVLIPYYPEQDTLVICDGSTTGLGEEHFSRKLSMVPNTYTLWVEHSPTQKADIPR